MFGSFAVVICLVAIADPGIIIAFNNDGMKETISYAASAAIKRYGKLIYPGKFTSSSLFKKIEITNLTGEISEFIYDKETKIKTTGSSSISAYIPLSIVTNEDVFLKNYIFIKTHPSETHMYLGYPGVYLNMEFVFGLEKGNPTITLANQKISCDIENNNNFSFFRRIKYFEYDVDSPYKGFFKNEAYKAFKTLISKELTTDKLLNVFNTELPKYTKQPTVLNLSNGIQIDYSNLKPYYSSNGFWISEINGTMFNSTSQASNIGPIGAYKLFNYSAVQMFVSLDVLRQSLQLINWSVNINNVNLNTTFIYTMDCMTLNPTLVRADNNLKFEYSGSCKVHSSKYIVNVDYKGSYQVVPYISDRNNIKFILNSTLSQYDNQTIVIESGNGENFIADKDAIYSALEKQIASELYGINFPLPKVRCIEDLRQGFINMEDKYLSAIFNIDSLNFCYLP